MKQILAKLFIFLPVLVVYIAALPVDVMEIDAAQYAEMSREMLETGNYLELFCREHDYLDKPPFLFWISVLSYKLFGVSNFAYKLPSLLFTLLGIYATYRLGKRLYDEKTGYVAALVLSTTEAWFQFTNDVRTDTILAGAVIFSIWQLKLYIDDRKWLNWAGAAMGISIALLTKGPIGLMVPVLALGMDMLMKRDWKGIFRWQWLLMAVAVLLMLSPMLWGLYRQYDLHPGKIINEQEISSGIRFYFWTQSFGRITGESNWQNDPSPWAFLPVLGWAFLPWTFFLLGGLWQKTREIFRTPFRYNARQELITWFGFLLPFLAFSLSKYKLPHYIFVLFPLGAILSTRFIVPVFEQAVLRIRKLYFVIISVISGIAVSGAILLLGYIFPGADFWKISIVFFLFIIILVIIWKSRGLEKFLWLGAGGTVILNLVMNLHFYPELLKYQAPGTASKFYRHELQEQGHPVTSLFTLGYTFDFYARQTMTYYNVPEYLVNSYRGKKVWVYTNADGIEALKGQGLQVLEEYSFQDYKVTKLSLKFLNPETREFQVGRKFLVLVEVKN